MEKYSTGIRNQILSGGSMRQALKNGKLLIYSGTQPTDADSAVNGTLLCEITNASGTWTTETPAQGKVVLTTWTGNSCTAITVSGVECLGTTIDFATYGTKILAAAAMATAINKYNPLGITATSDGVDTVYLTAPYGVGAVTWAVVGTDSGAGCVTTETAFGGVTAGVAPAYGLQYDLASSGAIAQSGTWSGTVTTAGTAGWFRIVGSGKVVGSTGTLVAESGGASTILPRVDGTITSTGGGGDITLTSTALALSAPITLTGVSLEFEATGK